MLKNFTKMFLLKILLKNIYVFISNNILLEIKIPGELMLLYVLLANLFQLNLFQKTVF